MSLTNFSLPFGALAQTTQTWGATISPLHPIHQLATKATSNLLYSPVDHQQQDDGQPPPPDSDLLKNNPYAPPQLQHQHAQAQYQYRSNNRHRSGSTYLPPIAPQSASSSHVVNAYRNRDEKLQEQFTSQLSTQQQYNHNNKEAIYKTETAASSPSRTYGGGSYDRFPDILSQQHQQHQQQQQQQQQQKQQQQQQQQQYTNTFNSKTRSSSSSSITTQHTLTQQQELNQVNYINKEMLPHSLYGAVARAGVDQGTDADVYPERPPGFKRVQAGQGSHTQVHAVLDYDVDEGDEDYYDANNEGTVINKEGDKKVSMPTVTPIQGPIFLKNGTVPVVPLFSYPTINNGSFVQIPIWWTALSVALGLDVRGDIIKGVPCIKRFHQLFCPTAGNSYPIEKIERFIDDNKALMRRMYGDFEMNMDAGGPRQQTKKRRRRFIDEPDIFIPPGVFPAVIPPDEEEGPHRTAEQGESYFGKLRDKRQSSVNQNRGSANRGPSFGAASGPSNPSNTGSSTGRLDACESKIEIVTPYWASNSAGKIRAIVNTQHFEQAIHQEICSKVQTPRCEGECGCEQKYKWHRLLAYDPDNDCKGIFMDWFLFPSCCVCRCNP